MPSRAMTVSELIKAVPDKTRRLWVENVKDDLYQGGFNPDPDRTDELESAIRGWFELALRTLYEFAPVLVNDDPDED
jgi:hypothetical protein